MTDIYDRQRELDLHPPNSIAVVGVGGIGSWIALNFALVGTKKIILCDHDIVESHNLNRTPFKLSHVNELKVQALAELILERRRDCNVIPLPCKIEDVNEIQRSFFNDIEYVIDCRDIKKPLPSWLKEKKIIALGYDGFRITIHFNPNYNALWGDPVRYTIVPSFLCPPQFLANFVTLYLCTREFPNREIVISFDTRDIMNMLLKNNSLFSFISFLKVNSLNLNI